MKKQNLLLTIFAIILSTILIDTMAQTNTMVKISTTEGDFIIKLYNETPKHRDNFIKLVKEAYYDSLLFHRVIQNFMIQTGDPNSKKASSDQMLGDGGPGYTIPAEFIPELYHKKGALAAARQGDQVNPEKKSSGSQFYIVQGQIFTPELLQSLVNAGRHPEFTEKQIQIYTTIGGTPHLDYNYTVFGEVVDGLNVIDKISAVPTNQRNRPLTDARIIKATIIE